jgi:pyruvate/2-oxoglutarate dehydrogenase complex dihydrolipoamide acyltransferase (E2) component
MTRLLVPQLDANLVDVTVTAWRKRVGDPVETGEIIAELTTDKASFELESPATGTLLAVLAAEKSIVPAGYVLALIGRPDERDPDAAAENERLMAVYRQTASNRTGPQKTGAAAAAPRAARVRATPRARRLAQLHNLDLDQIQRASGVEVVDETTLAPYLPKPPAP